MILLLWQRHLPWTEWHARVKTLPCSKLCLWWVTSNYFQLIFKFKLYESVKRNATSEFCTCILEVMDIGGDGVAHCAARNDEPDPSVVELPQLVGCTLVVHTHHPVIQAAHNLVVVHLNLQNNTHIRVSTHSITTHALYWVIVYWHQREDFFERNCDSFYLGYG